MSSLRHLFENARNILKKSAPIWSSSMMNRHVNNFFLEGGGNFDELFSNSPPPSHFNCPAPLILIPSFYLSSPGLVYVYLQGIFQVNVMLSMFI